MMFMINLFFFLFYLSFLQQLHSTEKVQPVTGIVLATENCEQAIKIDNISQAGQKNALQQHGLLFWDQSITDARNIDPQAIKSFLPEVPESMETLIEILDNTNIFYSQTSSKPYPVKIFCYILEPSHIKNSLKTGENSFEFYMYDSNLKKLLLFKIKKSVHSDKYLLTTPTNSTQARFIKKEDYAGKILEEKSCEESLFCTEKSVYKIYTTFALMLATMPLSLDKKKAIKIEKQKSYHNTSLRAIWEILSNHHNK